MRKVLISLSLIFLASCAHQSMKGTVVMKVDKKTGYVCHMGQNVELGDKVTAYKSTCRGIRADVTCEHKTVDTGTISKLINSHYSEVTFDSENKFSEGSFINIDKK